MTKRLKRCIGFNRNMIRCSRIGNWKLFCEDHKRQPLYWIVVLLFTIGGGAASLYTVFISTNQNASQNSVQNVQAPPLSRTEICDTNSIERLEIEITENKDRLCASTDWFDLLESTGKKYFAIVLDDPDLLSNDSSIDSADVASIFPIIGRCEDIYWKLRDQCSGKKYFFLNPNKKTFVIYPNWSGQGAYLSFHIFKNSTESPPKLIHFQGAYYHGRFVIKNRIIYIQYDKDYTIPTTYLLEFNGVNFDKYKVSDDELREVNIPDDQWISYIDENFFS